MSKTLQYGLYELCRMRIEQDEEFRAQSARSDLSVVDDELFDEYRLWQLKKTVKLDELARLVTQAKHTVLFGGAGMSTESGLADFRSAVAGFRAAASI